MKHALVVVAVLLFASVAMGQATATPTHTNTPTVTPTFDPNPRVFRDTDGAVLRTGSAGALSAWTEMPEDPVFHFIELDGDVTWKLWCTPNTSWPSGDGVQMSFDDGSSTVSASAILTLRGHNSPSITPAAPDRSFIKLWCRIELDACDTCDAIVRYSGRRQ